jgi:hypothetical protein
VIARRLVHVLDLSKAEGCDELANHPATGGPIGSSWSGKEKEDDSRENVDLYSYVSCAWYHRSPPGIGSPSIFMHAARPEWRQPSI